MLEASYLVFLLQPHHANFNKRLVKSPKLYFFDTGLLCWLLGIQQPAQLDVHPLRGSIFETFVIAELRKAWVNGGEPPMFYFWRDSNGNEVDLLIETGAKLLPVEIKSGQTVNRDYFKTLDRWTEMAGSMATDPTLIYAGDDEQMRRGVRVLGWRQMERIRP